MNTSDSQTNVSELDLSGLKVVVVDDSKTILRTAEVLLGEQGCWVVTASDGFESLANIASFKPDVIFVDIMMPRLDGYQTCALIKANRQYRDIPVIMLSSKDSISTWHADVWQGLINTSPSRLLSKICLLRFKRTLSWQHQLPSRKDNAS